MSNQKIITSPRYELYIDKAIKQCRRVMPLYNIDDKKLTDSEVRAIIVNAFLEGWAYGMELHDESMTRIQREFLTP